MRKTYSLVFIALLNTVSTAVGTDLVITNRSTAAIAEVFACILVALLCASFSVMRLCPLSALWP